jgi:anaerobic selenocysteine-containing dehydrogenase
MTWTARPVLTILHYVVVCGNVGWLGGWGARLFGVDSAQGSNRVFWGMSDAGEAARIPRGLPRISNK